MALRWLGARKREGQWVFFMSGRVPNNQIPFVRYSYAETPKGKANAQRFSKAAFVRTHVSGGTEIMLIQASALTQDKFV
jgi:hypothetical protein